MINVHKIREHELLAYSPDNQFLGIIRTETELLYFRSQICQYQLDGYYLVDAHHNDEVIKIRKDGKYYTDPSFYKDEDLLDRYLNILVGF